MITETEPTSSKAKTGMTPALRSRKSTSLENVIKQMINLCDPEKQIRAHFGADLRMNNTAYDQISPKRKRITQVKNIIEVALAWISYQALCFNEKRKLLNELAEEKFGSVWENNKHLPFGLCFDHKHNILYLKFFEKEVSEEEALKNFGGVVVMTICFPDSMTAAEFISCLYHECGCEIGHEDACPLYGYSLLIRELKEVSYTSVK